MDLLSPKAQCRPIAHRPTDQSALNSFYMQVHMFQLWGEKYEKRFYNARKSSIICGFIVIKTNLFAYSFKLLYS